MALSLPLAALSTWNPSRPGITRSETTTSNHSRPSRATASSPLAATVTARVALANSRARLSRMSGSSSTSSRDFCGMVVSSDKGNPAPAQAQTPATSRSQAVHRPPARASMRL